MGEDTYCPQSLTDFDRRFLGSICSLFLDPVGMESLHEVIEEFCIRIRYRFLVGLKDERGGA